MASPELTTSFSDPRVLSHDGHPLVWTRSGSGVNLVVMTDSAIAVGALPKSDLHTVEQRLEMGGSVLEAIGEKGKLIHFSSIKSITADFSSTDLSVVFKIRGRTKVVKLRFADSLAQRDALEESQSRMRGRTQLFETSGSRLIHLMKPLNFVVFFGMMTTLTHFYFISDPFEAESQRKKIAEFQKQNHLHRTALPGRPVEKPSAPRLEPSHRFSENFVIENLFKFGYLVLGSVAMILSSLGYSVAISILLFLTVISLFYLFYRVTHPPKSRVLARV